MYGYGAVSMEPITASARLQLLSHVRHNGKYGWLPALLFILSYTGQEHLPFWLV